MNVDDRRRLEPEPYRGVDVTQLEDFEGRSTRMNPVSGRRADCLDEVKDPAFLLQQHDRHATRSNPDEIYSAFRDRNSIYSTRQSAWIPRLWEPYKALSYVWGHPMFSTVVHTPDGFIPTTHNLADALYHLRHPCKDRNLWIDALCINQEDKLEGGHQVQGMAQVYARAEGVLVWLGPDTLNVAAGIVAQLATSREA